MLSTIYHITKCISWSQYMSESSLIYHNYFDNKLYKGFVFFQNIFKWKLIIPIIDQFIIIFDYLFYYTVNQNGSSNAISHEYFETG